MRANLQKRRDDYENAAAGKPPAYRTAEAIKYGLAREALAVLQGVDRGELDIAALELMAAPQPLAGGAGRARRLLAGGPADQGPPPFLMQFRLLATQANAAVGDYPTAIDHATALMKLLPLVPDVERALMELVADLFVPDADPGHPLTRAATMPRWGGLRR